MHEPVEMSDEPRGVHADVEVTVERVDVAVPRGGRRRREVEGARRPRPYTVLLLAVAAIVIALIYAGTEGQDAARKADANRQAVAAANRASDFANVLALHEAILAASRRTTRVFRAERGRMNTARARARLVEAVVPLEGLAFILRRGLAPIPSAADIWRRYLVCAFYTARAGSRTPGGPRSPYRAAVGSRCPLRADPTPARPTRGRRSGANAAIER